MLIMLILTTHADFIYGHRIKIRWDIESTVGTITFLISWRNCAMGSQVHSKFWQWGINAQLKFGSSRTTNCLAIFNLLQMKVQI